MLDWSLDEGVEPATVHSTWPSTSPGMSPEAAKTTVNEGEETAMRSLGRAAITTWAVLTIGSVIPPGTARAQRFGGGLGGLGGMSGFRGMGGLGGGGIPG